MNHAPPDHARSSRRIDAAWLVTGALAQLLAILNDDGEEARVVGGAVRNTLLGEPPGDFDIATTALPEEVGRRAARAGFKPVPTGIEHGTVTVVVHGTPFEVTTLRRDVETFGRHARVAFGRDWRTDAERRDFTVNALSVGPDGTVYDYVGGLDDLAARRVRFIGDPDRRIAEDYLRILRFFRFHAVYGEGPLDRAGLAASIRARAGLDQLSRERIRAELLKLLIARHAVPVLAVMAEAGLLLAVLGGVPQLASCANMAKVEAAAALAPDAVRRLGALALYVAEDADRLRQRLRLSNIEHERLASMIDGWRRVRPPVEHGGHAMLYRLGAERYVDRVLLAWSRAPEGASDLAWHGLATLPQRWTRPVLPLKAADLMNRGVAKGPELGVALRALEDAWIAAGFPEDSGTLAALADRIARDRGPLAPRGESA